MTTKLYGGDKRLYTAAEARRIDIERGGTGRIIKPSDYDQNWHLFFHEETRTWRICENQGGQLQHGIYDSPFCLVKEIWSALTSEPEPIVLDYLVLVDANERIKQLEKELKLLQEANDEVHDLLASREKELAKYKDNYHEILADHGELTQKFDELTEKARWKSCRESSKDSKDVLFRDNFYQIIGSGHCSDGSWYLRLDHNRYLKLIAEQVKNWTWKYEADL